MKLKNEKQIAEMIAVVFSTDNGKELLNHLKQLYVYSSSFSNDPLKMAYLEGRRSLVLDFISDIESVNNE